MGLTRNTRASDCPIKIDTKLFGVFPLKMTGRLYLGGAGLRQILGTIRQPQLDIKILTPLSDLQLRKARPEALPTLGSNLWKVRINRN